MIAFQVSGEPVPFARARVSRSGHFHTPDRQRSFMRDVRHEAAEAMRKAALNPFDGPLWLQVRATYAFPSSWSPKTRAANPWKKSRPDASNIVKILEDACNKIVWTDDARVARLEIDKLHGEFPSLIVTVIPLETIIVPTREVAA